MLIPRKLSKKLQRQLFRKYEKDLPDSLKDFSISLHRHIYNSMTIDEAENFFYESI